MLGRIGSLAYPTMLVIKSRRGALDPNFTSVMHDRIRAALRSPSGSSSAAIVHRHWRLKRYRKEMQSRREFHGGASRQSPDPFTLIEMCGCDCVLIRQI